MPRTILDESHLHPAIRERVAGYRLDVIREVEAAVAAHPVVVVGMRQNPFPKRARGLLEARGIAYHYLEFGSYFAEWKRRGVLRMWTGWPTFPMVFIKGTLIGGFDELKRLSESGELAGLASA